MRNFALQSVGRRKPGKIAMVNRRIRRRGALLSVELVLALPILLMMTIAVIQFGLLFANLEQLTLASRVGAHAASESPALASSMDGGPVPPDVLDEVNQQLCSSGIEWCRVRLEHNVGGMPIVLVSDQGPPCECGPVAPLPGPPFDDEAYVRVTVCVPLAELMPNSLTYFGFSIVGFDKVTGVTQVRRVEP